MASSHQLSDPADLSAVTVADELVENIRRFNRDYNQFQERAASLAATTTFWVYDEDQGAFGPSKFVGFKRMNFQRYNAAIDGNYSGAAFDGGYTRKAIESVISTFVPDDELASKLLDWINECFGQAFAKGIDNTKWRFVRLVSNRKYWALVCNPDIYKGLEAAQTLDELVWTIDRGSPLPGDRVLIWQAKGRGKTRGVIALGEVTQGLTSMVEPEQELPFWSGPTKGEYPRIRFRVIKLPGLPLWEGDDTLFLKELAAARAKGGTVFSLEPEQWLKVYSLVSAAIDIAGTAAQAIPYQGQGIRLDSKQRIAIERHAQQIAEDHFISRGYEVKDVSRTQSYDLYCVKDSAELRVEVKGTTGIAESVFVTANEVEHARQYPESTVLFVVERIVLNSQYDLPLASGGEVKSYFPWNPLDVDLKAIQYRYKLPDC